MVGLHWFQYYDHPPGGRDDGEDYNFGLVDIHDRPYEELIMALAAEHRAAIARSPSPRVGSRGTAVLPRAAIDVVDDSLLEWPKSASLLPMYAVRGEAVFGDVHAAWNETGLFLAVNAMDSYTPELLALRDDFPLDEAFKLLVGTDAGAGPRVHLFHVVPEEAGRNILGEQQLAFRVVGCKAAPAIGAAPKCQEPTAAGVKARFFGVAMDQPRVLAELFLPWTALGVDAAPTVRHVRLEVGVGAFFRSRSMSMREGGVGAFEDPRQWSVVPLAD